MDHTDEESLREAYHGDNMTTREIAESAGVTKNAVLYQMKKFGIERRQRGERADGDYKRLTFGNYDGYERVVHTFQGEQRKVAIHRLVAVAEFGFDEVVGADVHHENGVKYDNRPENLSVMGHGEHRVEHLNEAERDGEGRFA